MTTSEANTKKSTRIDVAPESLRTIAHQEMMLAGFSADVRKPIWDGAYDLEHLQATYETAVGLGRDAAASAIAALAAWARVYPEGNGSVLGRVAQGCHGANEVDAEAFLV